MRNGELPQAAAAAGFEVMVTTDMNLPYQQNLAERRIAIVVLSTTSRPRIRAATEAVASVVARKGMLTHDRVPSERTRVLDRPFELRGRAQGADWRDEGNARTGHEW